jgi:hypothetical protein
MSKLSQGTQLYFRDPDTDAIVEVECPTSFNPGGNPAAQLDDTCLGDTTAKSKPGLRQPGQATLAINADPTYASHIRLYELSQADPSPVLNWVLGWSDGIGIAPTGVQSDGDFVLPTTRTWYEFEGYIGDFPFDFALNTLVTSQVSIQRSGAAVWTPKAP